VTSGVSCLDQSGCARSALFVVGGDHSRPELRTERRCTAWKVPAEPRLVRWGGGRPGGRWFRGVGPASPQMRGCWGPHRVVDPDNSAHASFRGRAHQVPGCRPASACKRANAGLSGSAPRRRPRQLRKCELPRRAHPHTGCRFPTRVPELHENRAIRCSSGTSVGKPHARRATTLEPAIRYGGRVNVTRT
jgi:hypothetical protein